MEKVCNIRNAKNGITEVDDKNLSGLRWKTHMTGFEEERYRYNEVALLGGE